MTAAITDFNQFTGLRAAAQQNDPAALREVASQFEALFLQSMLKSMREASLGDPIFGDSDQMDMYQGMMDQQLSLEMASGKGVGLADMLVRQLGGADTRVSERLDGRFSLADIQRTRFAETTPARLYNNVSPSAPPQGPAATPMQSTAPPTSKPAWSDPESFARDIWPHAERAGRRLQVAPEAIVAQAALETGWGAHVMPDRHGANSFNLFGIKASGGWQGEQVSRRTLEFEDGVPRPQTARFRAYDNVAASFADYTDFLADNPRYRDVSGHGNDVAGFANALQSAGYATDPKYAEKLARVVDSPTMRSVIRELKNSAAQPIATQLALHTE